MSLCSECRGLQPSLRLGMARRLIKAQSTTVGAHDIVVHCLKPAGRSAQRPVLQEALSQVAASGYLSRSQIDEARDLHNERKSYRR